MSRGVRTSTISSTSSLIFWRSSHTIHNIYQVHVRHHRLDAIRFHAAPHSSLIIIPRHALVSATTPIVRSLPPYSPTPRSPLSLSLPPSLSTSTPHSPSPSLPLSETPSPFNSMSSIFPSRHNHPLPHRLHNGRQPTLGPTLQPPSPSRPSRRW